MRQSDQSVAGVEIALHLTKVGLERPECQKHPARDAKAGLDGIKGAVKARRVPPPVVDPVLADQRARKCDEVFLENPLAAVGLQHLRVDPCATQHGFGGGRIKPHCGSLGADTVKKSRQRPAAGLREGGCRQ